MKGRKAFTLIELLVVITIIAILAAILFPVFARVRDTARASTCQSNMKQMGVAMKQYIGDWDEMYPTNRDARWPDRLSRDVRLSTEAHLLADRRFEFGVNWVEALYTYMERATQPDDPACVWKCPRALEARWPNLPQVPGHHEARVTYAMNSWMCEVPESGISGSSNVMLVRELDRRWNATLRPSLGSRDGQQYRPHITNVFLNKVGDLNGEPLHRDFVLRTELHRAGSHILFTDGSVRFFTLGYMPPSLHPEADYTDPMTGQLWNSLDPNLKQIAISPSSAN